MPGTSSISLPPSGSHICLCPTTTARVPRPRNAFILYRQHHHSAVVAEYPGKSNPEISKIIGEQWRSLPQAEKEFWIQQGDVEKKSHLERFPDYRYQPRRNSKKGGAGGSNNNSSTDNNNSTGICPNCKGITSASNSTSFVNSYKNQQQQQNQQQRSQPQQQLPPAPSNQIPPPPPPPQQQLQPHQILSQPSSLTSSPSLSQAHLQQQPPYYPSHLSHPLPNSPSFQPNHFPPPAPLQPLNYEGPPYPHPYPLHKGSAPASSHYSSYESHSSLNQHLFNASVRHQSAPEISKSYPYKQLPTGTSSSKPSISTSLGSISSISSSASSSISSSSSSISSVSSLPPLPRIIPREELINGQQPLTPKMSPDLRNTSWPSASTLTSRPGSTDSPLRPFTFYDKPPPPPSLPASTINASSNGHVNSTSKPKEEINSNTNSTSTLPLKINTSGPFTHPQGFSAPSATNPHHPPPSFPQTKFKSSLYTTLTTLSEEEDRFKKRRTSSYHDPLINTPVNTHTPSLLSRGERYQSAIALASTSKLNSITERDNLSVRDKAEILSTTCDVANDKENRLIIAIEGPDTEMVQKVSRLLAEKVGRKNGYALSINDEIKSRLANSGFKNEKANSIFKIACVHELLSNVDLTQLHYLFLGGYLIHLTDSLASENNEIKKEHEGETEEKFKKYSERWYSGASMLRGLPGPNVIVYLQPQEDTRVSQQHGEITMVELKGGSRMLIIGGAQHERKEQDITENIMKAANIKLDEKDL